MPQAPASEIQRTLLRAFVGALSATALVAIVTLLIGEPSELSARILGTTATLTWFSLFALASSTTRTDPGLRALMFTGVGSGIVGFFVSLTIIWSDFDSVPWRPLVWAIIISTASAHAALLLRLHGKSPQTDRVLTVTLDLNALLTLWLCALVASDRLTDAMASVGWRLLGVVSVLLALGTLLTPIMPIVTRERTPPADPGRPAPS